jgi:hypothetical protein
MGNGPTTYATGSTTTGYYWSAYKQVQDTSHSKYRAMDGTGYTIRGYVPSDGFSSPQRMPYGHWGTGYPDSNTGWSCGAFGYTQRFQSLAAVNASSASRIKSTDDTQNAWGLRNMPCSWSFGFICYTKSRRRHPARALHGPVATLCFATLLYFQA